MREPRLNTEREMLEKLRYGGVTGRDGLTETERLLIDGSAELIRELSLNQVLDASGFSGPEAPPVADRLTAAIAAVDTETAWEDKGKMRSLLVGKKWYWQAAIIATVVVLVVVAAAVWPWRVNVTPWGGIGVGNQAAWATVDGFVVDFIFSYPDSFTGTAADPVDHPLNRLWAMVDAWAGTGTAENAPVTGPQPADLKIDHAWWSVREKSYRAEISIELMTPDRAAVDDMVEQINSIGGISDLKVYSQAWYYSEKYPESRFVGREVCMNGKVYSYPQDIDDTQLPLLRVALNIYPAEDGQMYFVLDDIPEFQSYGLGDIVRVSWEDDGRINVDNTGYELEFSELGLPSWLHSYSMYVPASETGSDLDIVELMKKHVRVQRAGRFSVSNRYGWRLVVDLVPRMGWPGVDDQASTAVDLKAAEDLVEICEAAVEQLLTDYPAAAEYVETKVYNRAGVQLQWMVDVLDFPPDDLASLARDCLQEVGVTRMRSIPILDLPGAIQPLGKDVVFPDSFPGAAVDSPPGGDDQGDDDQLVIKRSKADQKRTVEDNSPRMSSRPLMTISQNTSVRIPLLEYRDIHGKDEWAMVERVTDEQRSRALEQYQEIRRLVRDWRKQKLGTGELVNPRVNCRMTLDIPVRASVSLDFDPELGDDLAAYLQNAGFPEAELSSLDMPHLDPMDGKIAVGWLFEPGRFTGVNEDDVVQVFTPEEIAWANEMKAIVETAVAEFKQANGVGDFQSGSRYEMGVWWREYGGMPTGYLIPATFEEDSQFEDLFAALVETGLPNPRVLRPFDDDARGPRQEEYRRERGSLDMSPDGKRRQNVLMFYLPHSLRFNACSVEALPDTFTAEEKQDARDLLDRMQVALDAWLASAPSGVEASLVPVEHWGAIQEIALICNRNDRVTVLDLGGALSVEGAPVYQYGAGYLMQDRSGRGGEDREVVEVPQTSVNWALISQVRMGSIARDENYRQNLYAEFTPAEIEQSEAAGVAVLLGYLNWLELHPEMDEPLPGLVNINTMRSQYHLTRTEDLPWIAQVTFIETDEGRAGELLEDLKECVREAGCGIEPYMNPYTPKAVMIVEKE